MTTIASWINRENFNNPCIWTIGDTKVTDSNKDTLTLENSKVFELNIRCVELSLLRSCYFTHSIGYAYAGSCLVGLNVFATLNTIFLNLGGTVETSIPDLKNIATTAMRVINYYAQSLCSPNNPFEALIYGYCPVNKKLERFHISKSLKTEGFQIDFYSEDKDVILLGDKKVEILGEIISNRDTVQDKSSLLFWRSPLKTLSKITVSGKYETIGGGTQLNIANQYGCLPYQAVREKADSDMKFRNIDIHDDIGSSVGACFIAINGLDYNM